MFNARFIKSAHVHVGLVIRQPRFAHHWFAANALPLTPAELWEEGVISATHAVESAFDVFRSQRCPVLFQCVELSRLLRYRRSRSVPGFFRVDVHLSERVRSLAETAEGRRALKYLENRSRSRRRLQLFGVPVELKTTALNRPALLAAMAHYPPAPITPLARY